MLFKKVFSHKTRKTPLRQYYLKTEIAEAAVLVDVRIYSEANQRSKHTNGHPKEVVLGPLFSLEQLLYIEVGLTKITSVLRYKLNK